MINPTARPFAWRNNTARRLWILLWVFPVQIPAVTARDIALAQIRAGHAHGAAWLQFMRRAVLPALRYFWATPAPKPTP